MADLFQILGVARDADFNAILAAKNERLQNINQFVEGPQRTKMKKRVMGAWRVLGCQGSRERYLKQIQQDSVLDAARKQLDAQFQQEAAQLNGGYNPFVSPLQASGRPATLPLSPAKQPGPASPTADYTPEPMEMDPEPMEMDEPEPQGPPAQWFKNVAKRAITTIRGLRQDLNRTYRKTDRNRRKLMWELRNMPHLVRRLSVNFSAITEACDVLLLKIIELEDYCGPATVPAVRDDWDHRNSILARLPVARDLVFRFATHAAALDSVVQELLAEDGSDGARVDELLNDLGTIFEHWRQVFKTFQGGRKSLLQIALAMGLANRR